MAAPLNTALPTIAGTPQVGQTLTATSDGSWSGYPAPTLARNWQRNGVDIAGATASTYAVQAADAGTSLRLKVTATNTQGSATALSAALAAPALSAPAISSLAISPASGQVGTAFTAGLTVTGNPASTISRQWRLNGTDIAGATGSTYTATATGNLTVRVTATNSQGTVSQESSAVAITPALAAPLNTALPTIAGTPQVGQTLTATSDGSWSGYPAPTLARNWQRNGVDIAGATASTYAVQAADAGTSLRLKVTASNTQGSATALSAALAAPALSAPAISSLAISPASGQVGTAFTAGLTVTGNPASTISRQWRLNGTDIAGATGSTYTATATGNLTVRVTATNSQGTVSQESSAVAITPALAAPLNTALPTIAGTPQVGQTLTATSDGSWSGYPAPTLARNWQRNGVDIAGATASTYAVQAADAGTSLRLKVTATNTQGSATALSAALAAPALSAPAISSLAISPASGQVGTAFTAGLTVTGNPASTISRQWRLNGTDIAGATGSTYTATATGNLTVRVTATNSQGTVSQESPPCYGRCPAPASSYSRRSFFEPGVFI